MSGKTNEYKYKPNFVEVIISQSKKAMGEGQILRIKTFDAWVLGYVVEIGDDYVILHSGQSEEMDYVVQISNINFISYPNYDRFKYDEYGQPIGDENNGER